MKRWFVIQNRADAIKAMRTAGGIACIQGCLTALFALVAIHIHRSVGPLDIDGWSLFDAALYGVISWRLYKLSLAWAIVGFLQECSAVVWGLSKGKFGIVSLILMLIYVNAIRGAIFLRRHSEEVVLDTLA
jgi:hypothetical protein